jgi:hypothetical protein
MERIRLAKERQILNIYIIAAILLLQVEQETGFIIQKPAINKILGFEPISDRIFKQRVKGKFRNIALINMCSNRR